MKKLFLLLLAILSIGHAANLKVTKIIEDLNVYILENQYVVKLNGIIPHVTVGSKIEMDLDSFYALDAWDQSYTIWYGYDSFLMNYQFKPIGVIDKSPVDLIGFKYFIDSQQINQPLDSFTSLYTNNNWFNTTKSSAKSTFPLVKEGPVETVNWVYDEFCSYENGFLHQIYPIYDRNNTNVLAGILNLSKKRKVFLYDNINSLALFDRQ